MYSLCLVPCGECAITLFKNKTCAQLTAKATESNGFWGTFVRRVNVYRSELLPKWQLKIDSIQFDRWKILFRVLVCIPLLENVSQSGESNGRARRKTDWQILKSSILSDGEHDCDSNETLCLSHYPVVATISDSKCFQRYISKASQRNSKDREQRRKKITATWLLLSLNHFASFFFRFIVSSVCVLVIVEFLSPYLHMYISLHEVSCVLWRVHKQRHRKIKIAHNKLCFFHVVNGVYGVRCIVCLYTYLLCFHVSAFGSLGFVSSHFYPFYPAQLVCNHRNIKISTWIRRIFFLVLRLFVVTLAAAAIPMLFKKIYQAFVLIYREREIYTKCF